MNMKLAWLLVLFPVLGVAKIHSAYQFNVIVFERGEIHHTLPQNNVPPFADPSFPDAIQLTAAETTDATALPYTLLSNDQFALKEEVNKLNDNKIYKVLLTLSWWLPTKDLSHGSKTIHIVGGNVYDAFGNLIDTTMNDGNDLAKQYPEINGTMTISLNTYFDIHTHLQLLVPQSQLRTSISANDDAQTNLTPFNVYEINQTIRTRSQLLNYLDNPVFGVLIEATPYEINDEDDV